MGVLLQILEIVPTLVIILENDHWNDLPLPLCR